MMAFTEGKTKRECCLFWGGRHGGADENKNSGDGDVRAIALWWDDELGKKPENECSFFFPLPPFRVGALAGWQVKQKVFFCMFLKMWGEIFF